MLRVADDNYFATDTGRMRSGNEDNFFARRPLYAVCDGMGGAQAGEVASEIAARAFDGGVPDGVPPEQALADIIRGANADIHRMAHEDEGRRGMGCTCTSAYVTDGEVAIGHVGDSRAYRLRDGEMTRLTRDHSLVGEMVESGKLTEEEAERHPHRSVITRALGPEPEVQVDTATHSAKPGDIYLLCSDGLTSMVPEARIFPVLASQGSLETIGQELIAAANAAGGRDNITVILFRIEEVHAAGGPDDNGATTELLAQDEQPTEYLDYDEAELAEEGPRQGITRAEFERSRGETQQLTAEEHAARAAAEASRPATVAMAAIKPGQRPPGATGPPGPAQQAGPPPVQPPREDPRGPRAIPRGPQSLSDIPERTAPLPGEREARQRRRKRRVRWAVAIAILLFIVFVSFMTATRAVYFIGVDGTNGEAIAIYRGLPYELPAGIDLYERHHLSGVTTAQVPTGREAIYRDHKLRSLDDAEDLVNQLERNRLE